MVRCLVMVIKGGRQHFLVSHLSAACRCSCPRWAPPRDQGSHSAPSWAATALHYAARRVRWRSRSPACRTPSSERVRVAAAPRRHATCAVTGHNRHASTMAPMPSGYTGESGERSQQPHFAWFREEGFPNSVQSGQTQRPEIVRVPRCMSAGAIRDGPGGGSALSVSPVTDGGRPGAIKCDPVPDAGSSSIVPHIIVTTHESVFWHQSHAMYGPRTGLGSLEASSMCCD